MEGGVDRGKASGELLRSPREPVPEEAAARGGGGDRRTGGPPRAVGPTGVAGLPLPHLAGRATA